MDCGNSINSDAKHCSQILTLIFWKILTKFLILLSVLLLLILGPIFILLASPIYLFRIFIQVLAKNFRKDLTKIVTTRSTLFTSDSKAKTNNSNLIGFVTFDGQIDTDQFRDDICHNVINLKGSDGNLVYPELQQFLTYWFGFPFWTKTQVFDISDHVTVLEGQQFTYDSLESFISNQLQLPFPANQSPWHFTLIQNYVTNDMSSSNNDIVSSHGSTTTTTTRIVLKFHHYLCDGFSIFKLTSKIFPELQILDKFSKQEEKEVNFNFGLKILRPLVILFRIPFDFAEQLVEAFDWWGEHPWHKLHLNDQYHVVTSDKIEVSDIKKIKTDLKVSFATVIHGLITGGIRSSMKKHEETIPRKIHFSCPFPMRNHPAEKLRNHFTVGFVKLPVGTTNPLERLKLIEENLQKLKTNTLSILYPGWSTLIGGLARPFVRIFGRNYHSTGTITNMPGPAQFSYRGVRCIDLAFGAGSYPGLTGVTFGIFSYENTIRIVTSVDTKILSKARLQELNQFILQELQILKNLLSNSVQSA